jgi:hypothetical protein
MEELRRFAVADSLLLFERAKLRGGAERGCV